MIETFSRNYYTDYYYRGRAKYKLEQYEEAIEDLDVSILLNSRYAYSYYIRGKAKAELQQYKAAIEDYNMAIEIISHSGEFYYSRGDAKANLGQNNAAIKDYVNACLYRGNQRKIIGKTEEANQEFENALKLAKQLGDELLISKVEQYINGSR